MKLNYLWRSAAALLASGLFRALPIGAASALGGWMGRVIGPRLSRHGIARANLELALPELSPEDMDRIMVGMWNNLGRTVSEIAHLGTFSRAEESDNGLITFAGLEHLERLKQDYRGAIFVGGHLGNWEVAPLMLRRAGLETVSVYRPFNEPYIDRLARQQRIKVNPNWAIKRQDVKALVSALRDRRSVSMLVDQKLWQGELIPFFGHDAHTTTLPAKLALRYGVPIVPFRVERLSGARIRVSAYPPITLPEGTSDTGDEEAEIALTLAINRVLEGWIRERPEQWNWLHRRWRIKKKYANKRLSSKRPAPGMHP